MGLVTVFSPLKEHWLVYSVSRIAISTVVFSHSMKAVKLLGRQYLKKIDLFGILSTTDINPN